MASFLGSPKVQYFKTGTVDYLVGGKVYSYDSGASTTPRPTYPTIADALAGTNANTNPVILDSRGEASIVISGATRIVLKDSLDNTIWTQDGIDQTTTDILDSNGNELLKFVTTTSAVNEFTITNAATGSAPIFAVTGGDTNAAGKITSKGSGILYLDGGSTGSVDIGTTSSGNINLLRNVVVPATASVSFLPAGTVVWKASTTVPTGWLECDGSAISRSTYATLFADIGTTWGAGNGSTTFNLPTQARRTIVGKGGSGTATLANTVGSTGGAETHTLTTAEMPAHTHNHNRASFVSVYNTASSGVGASSESLSATTSAGGDGAHNNMQPSMVMMMIIKAY